MENINHQFQEIPLSEQRYEKNFENSCSCLARNLFLNQTLSYLMDVNKQLQDLQAKNLPLDSQNLRQIRLQDSTGFISKRIAEVLKEVLSEKGNGQKITEEDLISVIYRTFKSQFLHLVILLVLECIFRLMFSLLMVYLLNAVGSHNFKQAYILSFSMLLSWYLTQLFKQQATLDTQFILIKMKTGLAMLLYAKISTLTSYRLKSSNLGKISNLLSSDLAAIQNKIGHLTTFLSLPLLLIGYTIMMVLRIGWSGLIGTLMIVLIVPLTRKVSQLNGQIVKEANIYKDKRVQITTETIEGIRYVKLYGWEQAFKKRIEEVRQQELSLLRKLAIGKAFERAIGYFITMIASLVMIITATYICGIQYARVLSVLEIMSAFKLSVMMFTVGTGYYVELKIILGRFASMFNIQQHSMVKVDLDKENSSINGVQKINSQDLIPGDIRFNNFFSFGSDNFSEPFLKNINYTFHKGKLYGITGKVGSGKSTLLSAIIGELPYYSGDISVKGSIAFLQQEPVIFSASVRDNIVFGRKFDQAQYDRAVQLSCLQADFNNFIDGDKTILGDKGATISGGQRARLALARAIYSNADIFLLDDPISAVDSNVGKTIFEKCILQLSKTKTVILTTHQVSYLKFCDESICLEDGSVNILTRQSRDQYVQRMSSNDQVANHLQDKESKTNLSNEDKGKLRNQPNNSNQRQKKQPAQQFVFKNQTEFSIQVYLRFLFSVRSNYFFIPLVIVLHLATQTSLLSYMRLSSDFDNVKSGKSSMFGDSMGFYWGILSMILIVYFLFLVIQYYILNISILRSSDNVHKQMVDSILRSPSSFFDDTKPGILINKFSNDLGIVDRNISLDFNVFLTLISYIIVAIANICHVNLINIIPSILFIGICVYFYYYARPGILTCRKLDLIKKNPIFQFFEETKSGIIPLRIYNRQKQRIIQFSEIINTSVKTNFANSNLIRGLAFYLTIFSIVFLGICMFLGIVQEEQSNKHLFGVTIICLIEISQLIRRLLREVVLIQSYMVSVQRLLQFESLQKEKNLRNDYDRAIGLQQEVEAAIKTEHLHIQWPDVSVLQVKDLKIRYKKDLPQVLKGVSFTARRGEKIGIVGRTGAGKSSIANALFRLVQPEEGTTYRIDKYNALQMGLHSLRQHISVIPQFSFIFKGSIRDNLDPFKNVSDDKLWEALGKANLKQTIQDEKMDTEISSKSDIFSAGQKQMLCLARALVYKNKFLILDEATANVDMETDALIQKVIRESFHDTTVITIAHRIDTIADYDTILVIENGRVAQQGSPQQLLQRKGIFFRIAQTTFNKFDNKSKK